MAAAGFPEKDPQLMFELSQDMLSKQLDFADSLDNKIGVMVSLGSALLALIAGLFALKGHLDAAEVILLLIAGAAYARLSWVGLSAYAGRLWSIGPDLTEVWHAHNEPAADIAAIRWRVAAEFVKDFACNTDAYERKFAASKQALVCVVAETFALVIALSLLAAL